MDLGFRVSGCKALGSAWGLRLSVSLRGIEIGANASNDNSYRQTDPKGPCRYMVYT